MTYIRSIQKFKTTLNLPVKGALKKVATFFCLTLLTALTSQAAPEKNITVGILQIVAHPALDKSQQGIIDGHKKKYPKINITVKIAQGNILNATMISQKFVSDGVDVIAVLGTTAAQVAAKNAQSTHTPIVFASITDPLGAKLVKSLDKPGGLVTGVSNYTEQRPQLAYFKEILPNIKTLGFIYNPGEANSVALLEPTTKAAKNLGIRIIPAAVTKTTEVSLATQKLVANGIDGIFINNDNTALSAFDVIAQITERHKVPLFVSDTDMVKQGALAALGPDQYSLGLQCAEMLADVLEGKNPATMPVQFPAKKERYLNVKMAQKIGVDLTKELLKNSDKLLR